jgi:hypothetical protein
MRTNPFSDALDFLTQGEWTSYIFWLLIIASMLLVQRPGRSLGLDAILLRHGQESSDRALWGRLVRLLS